MSKGGDTFRSLDDRLAGILNSLDTLAEVLRNFFRFIDYMLTKPSHPGHVHSEAEVADAFDKLVLEYNALAIVANAHLVESHALRIFEVIH